MSKSNSRAAKSLILATGSDNPDAESLVDNALRDFVHQKIESQRIDLGGRTIVATLISHDPAHAEAILSDLIIAGEKEGLDIAMLDIEDKDQ